MSKYSSFKEHQLVTESWRRYLNEGQEEQLAQAGENALEELGEDEILARVAELPPEIQAQLDAAATDIAGKLANQLQEGDDQEERRFQDEIIDTGGIAGAGLGGLGGLVGALHWKIAAESALAFLGAPLVGSTFGAMAGIWVASALLNARKKLRKDLRDTVTTEPVSGTEPE